MHKVPLVSVVAGLMCFAGNGNRALGQDAGSYGSVQSFGISASYSPDSSHILIGTAGQRRTWTLSVEYTRLLRQESRFRLDYEGSVTPMFLESDPTVTGTVFTSEGVAVMTQLTPERVVRVDHGPVGSILIANGMMAPVYAYFGRQNTYAGAVAPLGARLTALPRSRIQPSIALDLGFVASTRDIPIDDAARFNYMFAIGPGIQIYTDSRTTWRLEYLYRHISNAGQGDQNPGVDQGAVRLTVSLHR